MYFKGKTPKLLWKRERNAFLPRAETGHTRFKKKVTWTVEKEEGEWRTGSFGRTSYDTNEPGKKRIDHFLSGKDVIAEGRDWRSPPHIRRRESLLFGKSLFVIPGKRARKIWLRGKKNSSKEEGKPDLH